MVKGGEVIKMKIGIIAFFITFSLILFEGPRGMMVVMMFCLVNLYSLIKEGGD